MAPAKQQQPKFVLKRKGAPGAGEHDAKRVRIAGDGAGPKPKPKPKGVPPPALKGKGKAKTLPEPAAAPKPKPVKTLKAKVAAAPPVPAPLPRAFTVVAGSYEKLLYGLSGTVALCGPSSAALAFALAPIFIFPAHAGAVKALGASPGGGKWLATGSADEVIKVWDLRRRREVGGLLHHAGSITALQFAGRAHLLSASEDGALALFHARDWALLRTLAGHKGRVNALAVHPSGKLALSVGRDRTLRMWDLLRGRAAASTKIYKEGEAIRWNAAGTLFALASGAAADVYGVDMARLHSITHAARIQDILFVESAGRSVLLIAAENKKVVAYAIPPRAAAEADAAEAEAEAEGPAPTVFAEFVGHTNRVKALASLRIALPTSPAQPRASTDVLVTISSDGRVLVYDVHALAGLAHDSTAGDVPQLAALAEYDSAGSRLTCLTVAEDPVGPEEKRSADPEGGEDHDPDEGSGSEEDEDRAQLEAEEEPEPEDEEEDA